MHRASCRFMPLCGITETLSDVESVREFIILLNNDIYRRSNNEGSNYKKM